MLALDTFCRRDLAYGSSLLYAPGNLTVEEAVLVPEPVTLMLAHLVSVSQAHRVQGDVGHLRHVELGTTRRVGGMQSK